MIKGDTMYNILPHLKKRVSMNREIYELEQSWEKEIQEKINNIKINNIIEQYYQRFGRGRTPMIIGPMIINNSYYGNLIRITEEYKKNKAIQAIKTKYEGNRSERRSKNKKNNNTFNECPKTLQDVIKQKQNRVRYSFNSNKISNKLYDNRYDKGMYLK